MEEIRGQGDVQTMCEVGCRVCHTRIEVPETEGIYKCKCEAVSVRVIGPVTLINEFRKGASVILQERRSS